MTLIQLLRKSTGINFTIVNHNTGTTIVENNTYDHILNNIDENWLDGTVEKIGIQDGILVVSIQRKMFRNYYRNGQSRMVRSTKDTHISVRKTVRDLLIPGQHLVVADPIKQIGYDEVSVVAEYPFTNADEYLRSFLDRRIDHIEAQRKDIIRVQLCDMTPEQRAELEQNQ